jgi:hypothetical protein
MFYQVVVVFDINSNHFRTHKLIKNYKEKIKRQLKLNGFHL